MRRSAIALLVAIGLAGAGGASGAELRGVRFEDRLLEEGVPLDLRGLATMTHRWIFTVSAAGFYTEPDAPLEDPLADFPKRLEINYFYPIEAAQFADMTRHWVALNLSEAEYARVAGQVEDFNALYRDVTPGDRYALTYLPGRGTELSLNGRPLGRIAGHAFSRALFAIWLGGDPVDESVKAHLLGRE